MRGGRFPPYEPAVSLARLVATSITASIFLFSESGKPENENWQDGGSHWNWLAAKSTCLV